MKDLINIMILIPILALAYIGYQRIFPDGFTAQDIPAVIQSALTDQLSTDQSSTDQSGVTLDDKVSTEASDIPTRAEPERDRRDSDFGYTDQQLLADANQESIEELKSAVNETTPLSSANKEIGERSKDRLDQAISLMDRLNNFGGQ